MELQGPTAVEGRNFGSTNIDMAFEQMVEERLKSVHPKLDEQTAWSMMHRAEYTACKCSSGVLDSLGLGTFIVRLHIVGTGFNYESARIKMARCASHSKPANTAPAKIFIGQKVRLSFTGRISAIYLTRRWKR